jgi:hypothetical protein
MTEPRTYEQLLTEAVNVFTEAARRTRVIGAGTAQEHEEPADFAEFVTLAVAGTAANVGSIEGVLAGRPGSWEADCVRQMLGSTVGYDETDLIEHRTEPLTVVVNVDDVLNELGYWDLYDEAETELQLREAATGVVSFDPVGAAGAATAPTPDQEAAFDRIQDLRDKLEKQRELEWADYGEALKANVLRAASELLPGLRVPVEVVVELHWQDHGRNGDGVGPEWRLWERARAETPLPGSGIPLKDYPLHVSGADVERGAGRRPLDRLERG